jgi:hypothetical protein
VSFALITLCVTSQRVFIVVVYFVIDTVRKLLDTPSRIVQVISNFCTFDLRSTKQYELSEVFLVNHNEFILSLGLRLCVEHMVSLQNGLLKQTLVSSLPFYNCKPGIFTATSS